MGYSIKGPALLKAYNKMEVVAYLGRQLPFYENE